MTILAAKLEFLRLLREALSGTTTKVFLGGAPDGMLPPFIAVYDMQGERNHTHGVNDTRLEERELQLTTVTELASDASEIEEAILGLDNTIIGIFQRITIDPPVTYRDDSHGRENAVFNAKICFQCS